MRLPLLSAWTESEEFGNSWDTSPDRIAPRQQYPIHESSVNHIFCLQSISVRGRFVHSKTNQIAKWIHLWNEILTFNFARDIHFVLLNRYHEDWLLNLIHVNSIVNKCNSSPIRSKPQISQNRNANVSPLYLGSSRNDSSPTNEKSLRDELRASAQEVAVARPLLNTWRRRGRGEGAERRGEKETWTTRGYSRVCGNSLFLTEMDAHKSEQRTTKAASKRKRARWNERPKRARYPKTG